MHVARIIAVASPMNTATQKDVCAAAGKSVWENIKSQFVSFHLLFLFILFGIQNATHYTKARFETTDKYI